MDINISPIPGEQAICSICNMVTALSQGQDEATRKEMYNRALEITAPWHNIAVEMSKQAAALVSKLITPPKQ